MYIEIGNSSTKEKLFKYFARITLKIYRSSHQLIIWKSIFLKFGGLRLRHLPFLTVENVIYAASFISSLDRIQVKELHIFSPLVMGIRSIMQLLLIGSSCSTTAIQSMIAKLLNSILNKTSSSLQKKNQPKTKPVPKQTTSHMHK